MIFLMKKDFLLIRKSLVYFSIWTLLCFVFLNTSKGTNSVKGYIGSIVLSNFILMSILMRLFAKENKHEKGMLLILGYSKKSQVIGRSIYLLIGTMIGSFLYSIMPILSKSYQKLSIVEICFSILVVVLMNGYYLLGYSNYYKSISRFYMIFNLFFTVLIFDIVQSISDGIQYRKIEEILFAHECKNSIVYLLLSVVIIYFYIMIGTKQYEKIEV